ncbi:hypothetical protein GDO78_009840 [Eleutherodactylus coqui]|uniref:IGFBP N-terminal domain-containing protein n=1 Tax=Eleutherodactylus coqui TaxID=57060 RepID=A0A8J6K9J5_ELECQ|nr:hypothetical protein GDO78_009840 [Eleutherodactylus coqui]
MHLAGGKSLRLWHLVLLAALSLLPAASRALVCLPCDESKCEEPKNCPGSIVLGICGCCFMCARQKNESCGGVYGLHGACDRGLRCVIRPPLNGDSITEYEVGVCEDENWDDGQLYGFEPCNENFVTGCNIINGKCECDTIRTCNSPFEFPDQESCQTALKRIEGRSPGGTSCIPHTWDCVHLAVWLRLILCSVDNGAPKMRALLHSVIIVWMVISLVFL